MGLFGAMGGAMGMGGMGRGALGMAGGGGMNSMQRGASPLMGKMMGGQQGSARPNTGGAWGQQGPMAPQGRFGQQMGQIGGMFGQKVTGQKPNWTGGPQPQEMRGGYGRPPVGIAHDPNYGQRLKDWHNAPLTGYSDPNNPGGMMGSDYQAPPLSPYEQWSRQKSSGQMPQMGRGWGRMGDMMRGAQQPMQPPQPPQGMQPQEQGVIGEALQPGDPGTEMGPPQPTSLPWGRMGNSGIGGGLGPRGNFGQRMMGGGMY